jgi:hypothetical protein
MGVYVLIWSNQISEQIFIKTDFMNQVIDDWNAKPYDDIIITTASSCPSDYPKAVFERVFFGVNNGCNCLGIWDSNI